MVVPLKTKQQKKINSSSAANEQFTRAKSKYKKKKRKELFCFKVEARRFELGGRNRISIKKGGKKR